MGEKQFLYGNYGSTHETISLAETWPNRSGTALEDNFSSAPVNTDELHMKLRNYYPEYILSEQYFAEHKNNFAYNIASVAAPKAFLTRLKHKLPFALFAAAYPATTRQFLLANVLENPHRGLLKVSEGSLQPASIGHIIKQGLLDKGGMLVEAGMPRALDKLEAHANLHTRKTLPPNRIVSWENQTDTEKAQHAALYGEIEMFLHTYFNYRKPTNHETYIAYLNILHIASKKLPIPHKDIDSRMRETFFA